MNTELSQPFNFSDVPASWWLCFCDGCPRHTECLRYRAGQYLPEDRTWGPSVYPTAYRHGPCAHFKEVRTVRVAYGMSRLFAEVRQKDLRPLRMAVMGYLGGRRNYYRYNSGERQLLPEQQEGVAALFASYGYTDAPIFDHYRDKVDFS